MTETVTPETEVINPVTGKTDSLQNALNSIFGLCAYRLTAEEFEELDMSAEQRDGLNKTVAELEIFGKNNNKRRTFKCPAQTRQTI